jgi:hypothetical protein
MPVEALKCQACGGGMFRWTSPNDVVSETSEIFFWCIRCGAEIRIKVTTAT